jgi:hypothetical protein
MSYFIIRHHRKGADHPSTYHVLADDELQALQAFRIEIPDSKLLDPMPIQCTQAAIDFYHSPEKGEELGPLPYPGHARDVIRRGETLPTTIRRN